MRPPSPEWFTAVNIYNAQNLSDKDLINKLYMQVYNSKSPSWRNENVTGPGDAAILIEAITNIIGPPEAATVDEYEETMKAEEIIKELNL